MRNGIHTALAAWEDIIKMQSDRNKDHLVDEGEQNRGDATLKRPEEKGFKTYD